MLGSLVVATLLTLADPPGDATGGGSLTAPTATLMRERGAFDILHVSVPEADTFGLEVTLERASSTFPQAILEFYLTDTDSSTPPGTTALLPGSEMRLPLGQSWRYAVRVVGDRVQLFSGQNGAPREITEAAGARLGRAGTTLTLTTRLPLPHHFSLYGISGSYDPFSESGWRQLREQASPWGYAGIQSYPVLDVVAENAALQVQALEGGVLPEIRASFSESGWLLLSGAGVLLAVGSLAARVALGQNRQKRGSSLGAAGPQNPVETPRLETPLAPFDAGRVRGALTALQQGQAQIVSSVPTPLPEAVVS